MKIDKTLEQAHKFVNYVFRFRNIIKNTGRLSKQEQQIKNNWFFHISLLDQEICL